jgi:hypothetical protein
VHARLCLFALVPLSLLAAGCARDACPASEPSSTFESRVPTAVEQAPPGAVSRPDVGETPTEAASAGAPNEPGERSLCDELERLATLEMEEIPGGVALVASPRAGRNLAALRRSVGRIRGAIARDGDLSELAGAPVASAPASGERCALFDLGRLGVRVDAAEDPGASRLLFTAADPDVIRALREQAHAFVGARGR